MKVLWHSNAPWAQSGYGQQTALFAPRIRDLGHDVAISAMWGLGGAALDWEGMKVYPADASWGNHFLSQYAKHHGGEDCLVVVLLDVWVLTAPSLSELRMASWCPVDHDPVPPRVLDFFTRTAAIPVAMSRFGEEKLREAGLDPLYAPHGVDTQVFRPQKGAAVREAFEIPEDAFVVGMVAANKSTMPTRKAFPEVFQAFAAFQKRHENSYLFVHSELFGEGDRGINIPEAAKRCGVPPENLRWTPQLDMQLGVEPESLSLLYAMFNVLANPSYGEGFGIPIIEAQACGVPVIVTDFSSMSELCGAGWKVSGQRIYDPAHGGFFTVPSIRGIEEAFEAALEDEGKLSPAARAFALGYDADLVALNYWEPILERLASRDDLPVLTEYVAA